MSSQLSHLIPWHLAIHGLPLGGKMNREEVLMVIGRPISDNMKGEFLTRIGQDATLRENIILLGELLGQEKIDAKMGANIPGVHTIEKS